MRQQHFLSTLSFVITLCAIGASSRAVAPTQEAIEQFKAEGRWEQVVANLKAFKEAGGDQPVENTVFTSGKFRQKISAGAQVVDTMWAPVILVDFPDFHYNTASYPIPTGGSQPSHVIGLPQAYDSALFKRKGQPGGNPTGSMTDFYSDCSYGKLIITGHVYGWYTMPNNYSYYVSSNSGLGPTGAELAHDAVVAAATAGVDFTPYDNDGNGSIDGVIVVHAGPGAETGAYGVWSHRSTMQSVALPNNKFTAAYTLNPEEFGNTISPIGVFCHEWGHVLGLPDLYDISGTAGSEGIGVWSVMSSGNYNGNAKLPAQLDPWCKKQLGFIDLFAHQLVQPTNLHRAAIPQVETEPFVYYIPQAPGGAFEYFLIENREQYGFDAGLPGKGLLIYHIDELQSNNTNPAHYKVAILQADGLNAMAFGGSRGDAGDPFPGTNVNRNFHDLSNPNSRFYNGTQTQVAAWNISNADSIMYADLDTRWSKPWVVPEGSDSLLFTDAAPGGNGNGIFEAGETVSFTFGVRNKMRIAYGATATLACDDSRLAFTNNGVALDAFLNPAVVNPVGPVSPIEFTLPADWETHVIHFTLRLVMDSIPGGGDTTWNATFAFSQALGRTEIILVDDDNGKNYETRYESVLSGLGLPYAVWTKKTAGNPLPSDLAAYKDVFWFTGNETNGGVVDDIDIATFKSFMNSGGNVCLAGVKIPDQITAVDTSFMRNYLHAQSGGLTPDDAAVATYEGIPGNPVSDQLTVGVSSSPITYINTILLPINGGQSTFTFRDEFGGGNYGNGGVVYDGTYRSVFLSFAPEFLVAQPLPVALQPLDSLISRVLKFFTKGAASDVDDHGHAGLPDKFTLEQNYPNPFNPSTIINYSIPPQNGKAIQRTTLAVYNLVGQLVATLVDRPEGPGNYAAAWNGRAADGTKVASGAYFYRLDHGDQSISKKMILLK